MTELRAGAPALRLSAAAAATAGVVIATAAVAASLARPSFGLYAVDGLSLVTAVLAAGLGFFTALLGDPTDGRAWWGLAVRVLCLTGFAAALLTVAFTVMVVAGDGIRGLADATSRAAVLRGPTYEAALARCAGLCAVAAAFASLRVNVAARRALMVGGGVLVCGSFLLAGHARSHGPVVVVLLCLLAHVLGASGWAGGLVGLAVVLRRRDVATADRGAVLVTFAGLMTGVVTMLLAGGLGLGLLYLSSWHALVSTAYGQVLLVKAGLVAGLLIVSASNHQRVVPAAARGSAPALAALRMNVAVEQLGLLTVLIVTEVLIRQNPVAS
jgi:copper transport protein